MKHFKMQKCQDNSLLLEVEIKENNFHNKDMRKRNNLKILNMDQIGKNDFFLLQI
jgi:hypothetical protein